MSTKKFKSFIIVSDKKPTYLMDKDNSNFTQTEAKYLKWKCAKHDLNYGKIKVKFLPALGKIANTVILGFGQDVLDKFVPGEKLNNARGSVYDVGNDSVFIPTYHPDKLRSMRFKTENGEVMYSTIWGMDFAKWIEIYESGWEPLLENFNIYPTASEVVEYVDFLIAGNHLAAIDLETAGGQGEHTYPVMIGVAHNQTDGLCIPIKKQHKEAYWTPTQWKTVDKQIRRLFTEVRQMYQNAAYDTKVMLQNRYKVNFDKVEHDTMLLHHTIMPAMPHNLGFITSTFGQTPAWKDILAESGYNVMGLDDTEARTYNLRDCVVLHQCLPKMLAVATEIGCSRAYYEEAIPSIQVAIEQELTGIYVDPARLAAWAKYTKKGITETSHTLRKSAGLPKSFNLNSGDHLRWLLYQIPLEKFKDLSELDLAYSSEVRQAVRCIQCKHKRWYYTEHPDTLDVCPKCGTKETIMLEEFTAKPTRRADSQVYRDYLELKELQSLQPIWPIKHNKKISRKTGKQLLDKKGRMGLMASILRQVQEYDTFQQKTQYHVDAAAGLRRVHEWLALYSQYAKMKKYNSTYTKFNLWSDGCIHAHIMLHGTETGRPSSSGPNVLNFPKKEKMMRKMFVAPEGYAIVSLDYSNLEVKVLAYVTKDDVFIEDVNSGNVHSVNCRNIYQIDPKHPLWDQARSAAKTFQFACIQYGGSIRETWQSMVTMFPDILIPLERIEEAHDAYFERYKVFAQWREKAAEQALEEHITRSAFGRVRQLYGRPDACIRQAYNFPAQSTAAGIMNRVQWQACQARTKHKIRAKLQLEIYDDLRWVCKEEDVHKLVKVVKPIMEQTFDIYGVKRNFKVDIETGDSWGTLKEYKI